MVYQQSRIDAAQVETLAARQHRHRHLADFGGCENELCVRRRLFQRLQQRVERRARQHVHFVEDVDLVARAHRRVAEASLIWRTSSTPLCEAASISSTSGWRLSMIAWQCTPITGILIVGLFRPSRRAFVIERARKNACGGRFADPAHAGQNPGLRNAAGLECVRDRAHHGVLPDQVVEGCRPVFAREHAVSIARRLGRGRTGNGGFSGLAHRAIRFAAARRAD